mgnify:CR=1 FL=1
MSRELRGVFAGALAAFVWGAAEPLLRRAVGTPYSDIRLLGRTLTDGPHWRSAGLVLHTVNGAAFGWVFARLGGRGWKQGIAAAELETIALWPGLGRWSTVGRMLTASEMTSATTPTTKIDVKALPTSRNGLRPKRSPSLPAIGTVVVDATMYAVATHAKYSRPLSSATMRGSAVPTIV